MNWYKIAKKLKDVILKGKLKSTKDGFVYLKLDDKVIDGLFSLIDNKNIKKPPYHQKKYNEVGAHISIMSQDEFKKDKIPEIKEIGQEFNFTLGEFKQVRPKSWKEVKQVYFIEVFSEELTNLRKKYDLPATYKGKKEKFHITIAIEGK